MWNKKDKGLLLLLVLLLTLGVLFSISFGKYPISLEEILSMIFKSGEVEALTANVFWTLRFPRTIMTILSGVGLGVSGYIYQQLFKNPLASPDIIGVAGGANLGAAIGIVALSASSMISIATGAFLGGILAVFCVLTLAKAVGSNNTGVFVLAGIIINATTRSIIMALKYFSDPENELAAMEYWEMGSFSNITSSKLFSILPFFILALGILILMRRQVDLLSLNDKEAKAMGVRIGIVRLIVLISSTLLVSSVISVTGLVSFVGLVSPHIAKLLLKKNNEVTFYMSGLIGGLIVLFADLGARTLYTTELPISILTTIIGVPMLIYFMKHRKAVM